MNEYPPVSVYIVTYLTSEERCDVLRQTCRDVLALRYPEFEVVVSDNGGAHTAKDALRSLDDPRLKVFENESNEGFTGNINRCIKYCAHDIIKLMCDDDLIHPDFLSQTVPLIDDHTLVVAAVEKYVLGQAPKVINQVYTDPPPCEIREAGYDRQMWTLPYMASCIPSATLFKRSLFRELGGYDKNTITSDWDFFIEACLYANVIHVQAKLCFVGVWEGSLTEEMMGTPYFYPSESLYTKFRILRLKQLSLGDRAGILCMIMKDILWQGLRIVKHVTSKVYWVGYGDYLSRHFRFIFRNKQQFAGRPKDL
jgi:glycosyltransferase involved in cell wall biosynthesis